MSFDARSKERLEALGRTLPKPLPIPKPQDTAATPAQGASAGRRTGEARHTLEKEEDPAELFRALMKASPDGSVPPHLLERLRELEGSAVSSEATPPAPGPSLGKGSRVSAPKGQSTNRGATRVGDDPDLYATFAQLLLEDDDSV